MIILNFPLPSFFRDTGQVLLMQNGKTPPDFYPVQAITIDDYCERNNVIPDFIKMDIEGAEPLALRGCEKTLKKYRPKFAVCIYHAWPHRWTIPLYLNELLPDYDFYVKKSHPYAETVFFGKSRENAESGEYETIAFIKE